MPGGKKPAPLSKDLKKGLPRIAIVPTGGTIQNTQPLVTSTRAGGSVDVLRAQRLYEPVTVKIAREDADGIPLPVAPGEKPFRSTQLSPEDGLYLLPYLEPGFDPIPRKTSLHIGMARLLEEIDRFGCDTRGQNSVLSNLADLVIRKIIDPRSGKELRVGGDVFTLFELVLIANTVNDVLREKEIQGCVVTQGTYSAEETACFLNYAVDSDKPVIVCTSQRRHTSLGNDGDRNLVDAVRVALHPEARGKGAMLVMNEEILPAREVTKTNYRPGGFVSSGGAAGALGNIWEDQVTFYFQPLRKHTFQSEVRTRRPLPTTLARVDIVKTYTGADGVPIEALIERALKERHSGGECPNKHGIVVEGFCFRGTPHHYQTAALEKAVKKYGFPVAVANRGDYGRVPRTEGELFIQCDNLMAVKARLLLTLAIEKLGMLTPYKDAEHPTSEEKKRLFKEIGRYQKIFDTH
jgi:L-asparaginase